MQVCTEEFRDKVDIFEGRDEDIRERDDILMSDMLEQLEFSIGSLCQDWSREWLHDLLHRYTLSCELIFCRTDEAEGAHSDGLEVDIACGDFEDAGSITWCVSGYATVLCLPP